MIHSVHNNSWGTSFMDEQGILQNSSKNHFPWLPVYRKLHRPLPDDLRTTTSAPLPNHRRTTAFRSGRTGLRDWIRSPFQDLKSL